MDSSFPLERQENHPCSLRHSLRASAQPIIVFSVESCRSVTITFAAFPGIVPPNVWKIETLEDCHNLPAFMECQFCRDVLDDLPLAIFEAGRRKRGIQFPRREGAAELFTSVTAAAATQPNGESQPVAGTNNVTERENRNPAQAPKWAGEQERARTTSADGLHARQNGA